MITILQIRKLRLKEVKSFTQGHRKWQGKDLNSGFSENKVNLVTTTVNCS